MREIKFRAIVPEKNAKIHFTLADLLDDKFTNREILWPWLRAGNKPDEYTGLKDKNGKEIYEGDIISSESSDAIAVVSKDGKYFMANDRRLTVVYSDSRIIGNIYENPELSK